MHSHHTENLAIVSRFESITWIKTKGTRNAKRAQSSGHAKKMRQRRRYSFGHDTENIPMRVANKRAVGIAVFAGSLSSSSQTRVTEMPPRSTCMIICLHPRTPDCPNTYRQNASTRVVNTVTGWPTGPTKIHNGSSIIPQR
jgi:hypothetical protein